ncbi:MAG: hypothetical protein ACR2HN_13270 [Tepidiformaceae bacterium]
MDALTLLHRARAAGLSVARDGDQLVVRGPRTLAELAGQLLDRKPEVLALLAPPVTAPPTCLDCGVAIESRWVRCAPCAARSALCEDCRPSHTGMRACSERPFVLGKASRDARGFRIAIHCPVCCAAGQEGPGA